MRNRTPYELKIDQQRFDARKSKLLEVFIPFRDAFIEKIRLFAEDAAEKELRGVEPPKIQQNSDGLLEVAFRLHERDLVLVSTDTVLNLPDSDDLAAKMFVYFVDAPDSIPWFEIVFQECNRDSYCYGIFYSPLWKKRKDDSTINTPIERGAIRNPKQDGQQAAHTWISQVYRIEWSWSELSTLREIRSGNEKSSLGFRTPEQPATE